VGNSDLLKQNFFFRKIAHTTYDLRCALSLRVDELYLPLSSTVLSAT
jgi:hypothetical protein